MKKWLLLLTIMLLTISIATATNLEMCEDFKQEINTNCTMPTPVVDCANYTYTIYNISGGGSVEEGNLSNLNDNIFALNITQPEGDYIILLCDNTTREIKITQEDETKMIVAMIILLPMLLGFFFLLGAVSLNEKHNILRVFLFLLSFPLFFASMNLGIEAIAKFYNFDVFIDTMGYHIWWIGILFSVLLMYFLIRFIIWATHYMAGKKEARYDYES